MLKTRNFFIGLGLGFLISGLILSFYSSFSYDNLNGLNKQYTVEELKAIAKKENLYLYTKDELEALLQKDGNNTNILYFAIPSGFSSNEVADYLSDVGVLKDKEKFLNILDTENLTTKIIAKTYYYDQELSTEELIELITNTDQANW